MRHIFVGLMMVFALLFLLANALVWVRSYKVYDRLALQTKPSQQYSVHTSPGFIYFCRDDYVNDFGEPLPMWYQPGLIEWASFSRAGWGRSPVEPPLSFLGFSLQGEIYTKIGPSENWGGQSVRIPFWFPVALLTTVNALHVKWRLTHHKRLREGHCLQCGYDLRGTPECCPECGLIAPSALREEPKPPEKKISGTLGTPPLRVS